MFLGTFKETIEGECRVAISPESCKKLTDLGFSDGIVLSLICFCYFSNPCIPNVDIEKHN